MLQQGVVSHVGSESVLCVRNTALQNQLKRVLDALLAWGRCAGITAACMCGRRGTHRGPFGGRHTPVARLPARLRCTRAR